jgi:lysophospholipase L1-like esterase
MTKPSRTVWSALAAVAALALATPTLLGLTTASSAAPRQPVVYDALGDSYASGFGVAPYTGGSCQRSDSAYAVQLDGRMKIDLDDFVACAGATTATLVSGGQLGALDADTDLVTISIGGNDIGWSPTVGACLLGSDAQCAGSIALTRGKITNDLPAKLASVYDQVAARASGATVLVTGYPHLFSDGYGPFLGASAAEQVALNDGADLLNSVLAQAATAHGFGFVDVTKRFLDHGANASDPWLHGLDAAAFHPNAEGYEAYTAAVTAAVVPARLG